MELILFDGLIVLGFMNTCDLKLNGGSTGGIEVLEEKFNSIELREKRKVEAEKGGGDEARVKRSKVDGGNGVDVKEEGGMHNRELEAVVAEASVAIKKEEGEGGQGVALVEVKKETEEVGVVDLWDKIPKEILVYIFSFVLGLPTKHKVKLTFRNLVLVCKSWNVAVNHMRTIYSRRREGEVYLTREGEVFLGMVDLVGGGHSLSKELKKEQFVKNEVAGKLLRCEQEWMLGVIKRILNKNINFFKKEGIITISEEEGSKLEVDLIDFKTEFAAIVESEAGRNQILTGLTLVRDKKSFWEQYKWCILLILDEYHNEEFYWESGSKENCQFLESFLPYFSLIELKFVLERVLSGFNRIRLVELGETSRSGIAFWHPGKLDSLIFGVKVFMKYRELEERQNSNYDKLEIPMGKEWVGCRDLLVNFLDYVTWNLFGLLKQRPEEVGLLIDVMMMYYEVKQGEKSIGMRFLLLDLYDRKNERAKTQNSGKWSWNPLYGEGDCESRHRIYEKRKRSVIEDGRIWFKPGYDSFREELGVILARVLAVVGKDERRFKKEDIAIFVALFIEIINPHLSDSRGVSHLNYIKFGLSELSEEVKGLVRDNIQYKQMLLLWNTMVKVYQKYQNVFNRWKEFLGNNDEKAKAFIDGFVGKYYKKPYGEVMINVWDVDKMKSEMRRYIIDTMKERINDEYIVKFCLSWENESYADLITILQWKLNFRVFVDILKGYLEREPNVGTQSIQSLISEEIKKILGMATIQTGRKRKNAAPSKPVSDFVLMLLAELSQWAKNKGVNGILGNAIHLYCSEEAKSPKLFERRRCAESIISGPARVTQLVGGEGNKDVIKLEEIGLYWRGRLEKPGKFGKIETIEQVKAIVCENLELYFESEKDNVFNEATKLKANKIGILLQQIGCWALFKIWNGGSDLDERHRAAKAMMAFIVETPDGKLKLNFHSLKEGRIDLILWALEECKRGLEKDKEMIERIKGFLREFFNEMKEGRCLHSVRRYLPSADNRRRYSFYVIEDHCILFKALVESPELFDQEYRKEFLEWLLDKCYYRIDDLDGRFRIDDVDGGYRIGGVDGGCEAAINVIADWLYWRNLGGELNEYLKEGLRQKISEEVKEVIVFPSGTFEIKWTDEPDSE